MPRKTCIVLLLLAVILPLYAADYSTTLDRYVAQPDSAFQYQLLSSGSAFGLSWYIFDVTSQQWLTSAEVDRPLWKHWLIISKPDHPASSTALLVINGGSNGGNPPTLPNLLLAPLVLQSQSVVAELSMVPNEPLQFADEDHPRTEDAIIAYTWDKFLKTGDERWPARLPMTKAAVRAMDIVQEFCASNAGGNVKIDNFIVSGASKRGWTTWTTAAADKRVSGIIPLVDALNVKASFIDQFRSYGSWSTAIQDYIDIGLPAWLGTPQFDDLMQIEDPWSYRDRFTMPKYLVNAAGDQFFPPDSAQFYFNDLPGEKYLRYIPNVDHYLDSPDAAANVYAFYLALQRGMPRPQFQWQVDRAAGAITLTTTDQPAQVRLWQATNPNGRDFRLMTIGKVWTSTDVNGSGGVYTVTVPKPDQGFTAFFLELTYPGPDNLPLVFTTEIVVTPDVYPFDLPS